MRRTRKIPDWRLQAVPQFRDVHPDKIAVPLRARGGGVAIISDLPATLVEVMECAAELTGKTFNAWYLAQVEAAIERDQ